MYPHHTLEQLNHLRLSGMAQALSEQLDQPNTYEELGFGERLALLVEREATSRDNRKITRLLRQAKLRLNAHAAEIDYQTRRGLKRDTVAQLLQLEWIRHHCNLLIEGPTGTGKTFLACAIGRAACERGLSVRDFRMSRLFEALNIAHGQGTFGRLLTQLGKTELLILDDWGLEAIQGQSRNDLLEVIEERHGQGATVVASQLPSRQWHDTIGDPTIADAVLDRLIHNATKISLKGESLRKRAAKLDQT